ncbi:MAG TPA: SDR family oxidoreductase [Nocardioidaceae bacterium]|jgi:3-oxoacyl-[acyl-carrier protein] reductase|nr:SDR family oxidoreductase [Nocardioidaceae bacterium]
MNAPTPLAGRRALVTGVSRRRGIGYAVARRLLVLGADVALHHHPAHDREVYGSAESVEDLVDLLHAEAPEARIVTVDGDLADVEVPGRVVEQAASHLGHLDILVCNHAHGGDAVSLTTATPAALDRHWAVNTRATLLLTQALAAQHDGREGGRVVWMTSGQGRGPMSDNLAYATSKAALAGVTRSVADELAGSGIVLNTVNPGPVNTGYLDDAPPEAVERFPAGRLGEPDDPARLIAWLVSDDGRWMCGEVLHTEGGFRR